MAPRRLTAPIWLALPSFLCLAMVLVSAPRCPAAEGKDIKPPAASLEDAEQRLGPFRVGGQDFMVVLQLKRLAQARPDRAEEPALAGLAIRDASGAILHQETFSYSLEADAFSESCMASAQLLRGGFTSGLLVVVAACPSAPAHGDGRELCGMVTGRLSRLGKPSPPDADFPALIPPPPP